MPARLTPWLAFRPMATHRAAPTRHGRRRQARVRARRLHRDRAALRPAQPPAVAQRRPALAPRSPSTSCTGTRRPGGPVSRSLRRHARSRRRARQPRRVHRSRDRRRLRAADAAARRRQVGARGAGRGRRAATAVCRRDVRWRDGRVRRAQSRWTSTRASARRRGCSSPARGSWCWNSRRRAGSRSARSISPICGRSAACGPDGVET